jgi:hypothetical protein
LDGSTVLALARKGRCKGEHNTASSNCSFSLTLWERVHAIPRRLSARVFGRFSNFVIVVVACTLDGLYSHIYR